MTLLDAEAERWYCYKDDEVYSAKEKRWLEPRLLTPASVGRELTDEELIQIYAGTNALMTVFYLGALAAIFNLLPLETSIFLYAIPIILGLWLYNERQELDRKGLVNWPAGSFGRVFRRPRDKLLVALYLWLLCAPIGFVIIVLARVLRTI